MIGGFKMVNTVTRADLAEELYIKLRNELANGKSLFAPTYAEAMQQYIAYKQREVDVNALTDGRLTTIKAHLSHFVEYIDKSAKVSDVGINTLVQYERKGKETNYVLFEKKKALHYKQYVMRWQR